MKQLKAKALNIAKACVITAILLSRATLFCAAGERPVTVTNTTEDTVILVYNKDKKTIRPTSTETIILKGEGTRAQAMTGAYDTTQAELFSESKIKNKNKYRSEIGILHDLLKNETQPSFAFIIKPEDTKLEIIKIKRLGGRGPDKLVITKVGNN